MLESKQLRLRAPKLDLLDVSFLLQLRTNPEIAHQLINRAVPSSEESIKEWIVNRCKDPMGGYLFMIESKSQDNSFVSAGYITYDIEDSISRVASIGVCLSSAFKGKGLGTDAVSLMMNYLQNSLSIRKFMFKALASNNASRRLFAKLGFREVGLFRSHFLSRKCLHDVIVGEFIAHSAES